VASVGSAEDGAEHESARSGVATGHDVFDEGGLEVVVMAEEEGEDGGEGFFGGAGLAEFEVERWPVSSAWRR